MPPPSGPSAVSPPTPPNGDLARAMFIWVGGSLFPLSADNDLQALLDFSAAEGANVWFLDIWRTLGGGNWSESNRQLVTRAVRLAHQSGIRTYALSGNIDWATNQAWVLQNVIRPLAKYQALAAAQERFDGVCLDVEYWTDAQKDPAIHCPGLCDLIAAFRSRLDDLPVGCFGAFYLKDGDGSRASVSYKGKSAQDGEHLMDAADFVVVGAYRDTADDNPSNSQPGQRTLFQPWFDYAKQVGLNLGLYCGSETINVTPDYITYYGQGKTYMEGEHTKVSNAFQVADKAVFIGQAVHSYDGWRAMS